MPRRPSKPGAFKRHGLRVASGLSDHLHGAGWARNRTKNPPSGSLNGSLTDCACLSASALGVWPR